MERLIPAGDVKALAGAMEWILSMQQRKVLPDMCMRAYAIDAYLQVLGLPALATERTDA